MFLLLLLRRQMRTQVWTFDVVLFVFLNLSCCFIAKIQNLVDDLTPLQPSMPVYERQGLILSPQVINKAHKSIAPRRQRGCWLDPHLIRRKWMLPKLEGKREPRPPVRTAFFRTTTQPLPFRLTFGPDHLCGEPRRWPRKER